jgi:hypothetical protein
MRAAGEIARWPCSSAQDQKARITLKTLLKAERQMAAALRAQALVP